jgi:hypothetical protein
MTGLVALEVAIGLSFFLVFSLVVPRINGGGRLAAAVADGLEHLRGRFAQFGLSGSWEGLGSRRSAFGRPAAGCGTSS